ncbi:phage capsid protein [Aquamicrobium sp.]|uniref:phage capsid protein n=1 Tax=Aquamicrobium sp. TaxID=1872579 RepID=UPI002586194B|nr:phage capsid protein [Aquamicrobium sp.]MCK9549135.1 phage capsid protein [Aquamicrobium sp.]
MSDSAFQTQYRQELVAEFEEGMSWLRQCTVTEAVIKGNQAVFLVAGSGGAAAVNRGINGLIPARADSNTQHTATLVEWHDLCRKTRFNIFASQGDQRNLMQQTTRKVLNRRVDADVIAQLDTATNNLGAATTFSLSVAAKAVTTLGENEVPVEEEDKMYAVATPAVRGYIMQLPEATKIDYVEMKFLAGPARRMMRWAGFNWVFHPNLTGVGTNSEKCYFFHRDAIGSAFDSGEGLNTAVGYDDEQDYSYARASSFTGAKLLQQNGIVQFLHDASAI